jgi:hypothetical protein
LSLNDFDGIALQFSDRATTGSANIENGRE